MTKNLDTLIDSLRYATARDSVTPDNIATLFQAVREEAASLALGESSLSPISDNEIDSLFPPV